MGRGAEPYRGTSASRGYGYQWQKARAAFLAKREHAFCIMCAEAGRDELATVVNHRVPHRGDQTLFWDKGNWEPLCAPHHDQVVQSREKGGSKALLTGVTRDGRPADPAHPWNQRRG